MRVRHSRGMTLVEVLLATVVVVIAGSFVALWNSQIATGNWVYGNPQYTAPRRVWAYESSFASGSNLPPFTPWVVQMDRGAWWEE